MDSTHKAALLSAPILGNGAVWYSVWYVATVVVGLVVVEIEGADISAETGGDTSLILGLPGGSTAIAAWLLVLVLSSSASMFWSLSDAGVDGATIGVLA